MSAIEWYFDNMHRLLNSVMETQKAGMEEAANRIAQCLHDGHRVYTFGTGHGHLLSLEVFYRAGGMAAVCPILDEKLMLHKSAAGSTLCERESGMTDKLLAAYPIARGDVLFVASNSGRNTVPVELALKARERGAFVVALTSIKHTQAVSPRNPQGKRLFEVADLVLDNGGILGDACYHAADGRFVGPTSTAVGASILQAIVCRVKEIGLEKGWNLDFFCSSNVDGGDEINEELIRRYADIPGLK